MFGMEPGRESGGDGVGGGTVLMRFVWPHGGRSVFLSGSFDRWTRLVPMSPIEGSPTFFQAICSVAPGFHQYKFLVDGEWRHADGQPCSPSDFGIVNTVLVPGDANFNPVASPSLEMPLSMDVDTETFRRVVHISEGSVSDFMPRISEADLQLSRHRISTYMTSQTAYELLPTSGKAVALDIDLPVKQAFHILHEEGISMAPLWDASKSQFTGMLSASDFILILTELGKRGSNLTEEELDTHTISAWKEGKAYLNSQVDGHGRALPRRLVYAGPYDNLKDVSLRILQNEVASIPILYSENGSFPQLLHVASLSEVLYCICRYFKHCSGTLPVLQWPICAIPIGTWVPKIGESNRSPLAMLRPNAPLSSALNLLIEARVSAIPIVDDNDSLVDVYRRSDITALAKDRLYTHININEMTVHQALQFGQDVFEMRSQRCQMCLPSDTLHKVMERLSNPGVRRLIIVEAGSKRVEGIVTLSDVFRFLLG